MGLMTLEDFQADLGVILEERDDYDPDTASAAKLARLNRWINFAVRHVSIPSVFKHPALYTGEDITLTSASDYALASNLYAVESVVLEDQDDRLDRKQWERFVEERRINVSSAGSSRPSFYAVRNKRVYLNVAPSSDVQGTNLRIWYWSRPAVLTAGNTTEFEESWDQVVSLLSGFYGWAGLGQIQKADFYRDAAVGLINEHVENQKLDARDSTRGAELVPGATRYQSRY